MGPYVPEPGPVIAMVLPTRYASPAKTGPRKRAKTAKLIPITINPFLNMPYLLSLSWFQFSELT
jgi:hypothetical protein